MHSVAVFLVFVLHSEFIYKREDLLLHIKPAHICTAFRMMLLFYLILKDM